MGNWKPRQPSKENLEMKEITLDAPVSTIAPTGYLFCPKCGTYEHHAFRWCQNCTRIRLVRMKEMSLRTFIKITARHGSGPLNTLNCHLFGGWHCLMDNSEQPSWKERLFKEAYEIYYQYGGISGATYASGKPTVYHVDGKDYSKKYIDELGLRGKDALEAWKRGKIK